MYTFCLLYFIILCYDLSVFIRLFLLLLYELVNEGEKIRLKMNYGMYWQEFIFNLIKRTGVHGDELFRVDRPEELDQGHGVFRLQAEVSAHLEDVLLWVLGVDGPRIH